MIDLNDVFDAEVRRREMFENISLKELVLLREYLDGDPSWCSQSSLEAAMYRCLLTPHPRGYRPGKVLGDIDKTK